MNTTKTPESQQELNDMTRALMREKNIPFVRALYQIVDELSEEATKASSTKLACRKGCSFCCHQLVTATGIEWKEILDYQKQHGVFRALRERFKRMCAEWQSYGFVHRSEIASDCMKPVKDWYGIPCVFLDDGGNCTIYPVRPIDCRTFTSTVTCTKDNQEGVKRYRYPFEWWANNLIMDEEKRTRGVWAVSPLIHRVLMWTSKHK